MPGERQEEAGLDAAGGRARLDLLLEAEAAEWRAMQHYERAQYQLIRAFFQLITVLFVVAHLPLQMIKDRSVSLVLNLFFKSAMVLISFTVLRKAHWINHHERAARSLREIIDEDILAQPDQAPELAAWLARRRAGEARLSRLFRPEWGRLALGYALLFFSIALSFTLTIA